MFSFNIWIWDCASEGQPLEIRRPCSAPKLAPSNYVQEILINTLW
jgi:hypothetical protein